MPEIIKCHVLGVVSQTLNDFQSNDPGGAVWSGVRVRLPSGQIRFFPNMAVDAEASLIIQAAMDCGGPVELWLNGIDKLTCVYGVKHGSDMHYTEHHYHDMKKQAFKYLAISIIMLPVFGLGFLILFVSWQIFDMASKCKPAYSKEYFLGLGLDNFISEAA
ncbi:hypothetical protein [Methylobacterium tarhaniae]|uniref:hypothetical protein n=1 Tax=Methylobacterium tarhaniae TaxID=1187852 RepID=UPI003D03F3A9